MRGFALEYPVMRHTTHTHALVALTAVALAVTGVFAASERLTASAEDLLAGSPAPEAVSLAAPRTRLMPAGIRVAEAPAEAPALLAQPLERALERVTKKPFGIEIHPGSSPVPNDRFDGFHVGVDFETFEDEQDIDVPVFAVCDGRLLYATRARGYGGVAVQACTIDGHDVSVIYGHLDAASVTSRAGDILESGTRIGVLGRGYSEETDGVRKHLHLGLRLDSRDDIRGYVRSATETAQYLDALEYLR